SRRNGERRRGVPRVRADVVVRAVESDPQESGGEAGRRTGDDEERRVLRRGEDGALQVVGEGAGEVRGRDESSPRRVVDGTTVRVDDRRDASQYGFPRAPQRERVDTVLDEAATVVPPVPDELAGWQRVGGQRANEAAPIVGDDDAHRSGGPI